MWQCARVAARVGIAVFALAATGQVAGAEAKKPLPLLGLVLNLDGAAAYGRMALVSVDPGALRPLPGRTLSLFGYVGGWAFAPDRASLALAGQCQIGLGLSQGIAFVDVARLRPAGCFWLTGNV
ncbi:MAG: hypothetical protein H0V45_11340, partial [Actinobacteria bacterium]|nr:hypothetical protein [Actinomycetota bacterium]